jgi:hypothetical protein
MKGLSSLYRGLSGVEPTADDIGAVKKAGDTMTGALILSGSPTEPNQAATKSYVDSNSSSWGSIGGTLSNQTDLQNALNAKQNTLVSGTNIKTINSTSILGSGNLSITASAAGTNTQVQFNDSGSIGGDAGLTYDKTTDNLIVSGKVDASALQINGTSGNGHIDLKHQSADASPPSAFSALFADSNGNIKYKNDGGYYTTYSTHTNTANRVYAFQDKSYTLAEAGANTDITSILLNQSGLVVKGATSNALTIKPNETLSSSRTLNLKINDVDRTIDLSGNLTVSSAATISGTNTGDQTNITGNAGTATTLQTARSIYGNNFDGSAALSQIIASTFGGTGNGFTKFTGATSTEKTYTLPNANATILTDNTAVTVPQGGTGLATLTTAYGVVCAGTTANGSLQNAGAGTSGQYLKSNGASSLPSFASLDLATTTNQGVAYLNNPITIANNVSNPNTQMDIGACNVNYDNGSGQLLCQAITKTLQSSGAWTAGTNQNGLDTGARANSTYYNIFEIVKNSDNTSDILYSLSRTAPTVPVGYTLVAWIGAIRTDASGNIDQKYSILRTRFGQIARFQTGIYASGTGLIPEDNTIPQNTEGDEYIALQIIPLSSKSRIEINAIVFVSNSASTPRIAALFQDSTANALTSGSHFDSSTSAMTPIPLNHSMQSGTTSATTFKVRAGGGAVGTTYFNGIAGVQLFGGTMSSSITIKEFY